MHIVQQMFIRTDMFKSGWENTRIMRRGEKRGKQTEDPPRLSASRVLAPQMWAIQRDTTLRGKQIYSSASRMLFLQVSLPSLWPLRIAQHKLPVENLERASGTISESRLLNHCEKYVTSRIPDMTNEASAKHQLVKSSCRTTKRKSMRKLREIQQRKVQAEYADPKQGQH